MVHTTDNARKILSALTKIYQSFIQQGDNPITNPQLTPFNEYVMSMYGPMNAFFDEISKEVEPPEVKRTPILSRDVLESSVDVIATTINNMQNAALQNLINHAVEEDKQIVVEYFMECIQADWTKEPMRVLMQPKSLELFEDKTDESYRRVVDGFEQSVITRIKKINELSVEILRLRAEIESYCDANGLDFEKTIEEYNTHNPLPPPDYTYERCGPGLLEELLEQHCVSGKSSDPSEADTHSQNI